VLMVDCTNLPCVLLRLLWFDVVNWGGCCVCGGGGWRLGL
jgi:hypothetical protein